MKFKWLLPCLPFMMIGLDYPPPDGITIRCLRIAGMLVTAGVLLVIAQPWRSDDDLRRRGGAL